MIQQIRTPAAPAAAQPTHQVPGRLAPGPAIRSSTMLLLQEELARARMQELVEDAARTRLLAQLRAARKRKTRAEGSARRARRAESAVVVG